MSGRYSAAKEQLDGACQVLVGTARTYPLKLFDTCK
jgi:hypothetical protein